MGEAFAHHEDPRVHTPARPMSLTSQCRGAGGDSGDFYKVFSVRIASVHSVVVIRQAHTIIHSKERVANGISAQQAGVTD